MGSSHCKRHDMSCAPIAMRAVARPSAGAGILVPALLLIAAAIWLASTGSGRAEADGPDYFRVVGVAPNDVLNIRSGPGAAYALVGTIAPNGNGIRNLGCEGGLTFAEWQAATPAQRDAAQGQRWCRIAYQGIEGWAAGRFLGEGSAPASGGLWAVTGVAANDVLNIRATPSGNAAIIGALGPYETGIINYGCQVPAGSSTRWCQIGARGMQGWVAGRFLVQR